MGHYKVILECIGRDNLILPELILSIAHLPSITATPLQQWTKASQVMIEKGKGCHIDHLRNIQLCEADLNFFLHVIWGQRLVRHAPCFFALDSAQYALPGQMCNNAMLNKLLFLDLSRQTLSPGILIDFDATAAFDRFLAGLSIVTSQRMGLPRIAGIFMYQLLYNMSFNLITGFGTSSSTYNNTDNNLSGQGVLQGSSSAAPLFIPNSDVSLHTYNRIGSGASFVHPITISTINDIGVQYIDDT
jgi:hypothetical protein